MIKNCKLKNIYLLLITSTMLSQSQSMDLLRKSFAGDFSARVSGGSMETILKQSNCLGISENRPQWQSPREAYLNFVKLNSSLEDPLRYGLLSNPGENFEHIEVSEIVSKIEPLLNIVSVDQTPFIFYCSEMTLRNLNTGYLNIKFNFIANYDKALVSIFKNPYSSKIKVNSFLNDVTIENRTIVPYLFKKAPQLAGPLGFHEYIMDGTNFLNEAQNGVGLDFYMSPKFPVKFNIENCTGQWTVSGLTEDQFSIVFKWQERETTFNIFDKKRINEYKDLITAIKSEYSHLDEMTTPLDEIIGKGITTMEQIIEHFDSNQYRIEKTIEDVTEKLQSVLSNAGHPLKYNPFEAYEGLTNGKVRDWGFSLIHEDKVMEDSSKNKEPLVTVDSAFGISQKSHYIIGATAAIATLGLCSYYFYNNR